MILKRRKGPSRLRPVRIAIGVTAALMVATTIVVLGLAHWAEPGLWRFGFLGLVAVVLSFAWAISRYLRVARDAVKEAQASAAQSGQSITFVQAHPALLGLAIVVVIAALSIWLGTHV